MKKQTFDFDRLFRTIQEKHLSAKQDFCTDDLSTGMLCRTSEFATAPDLFYLVTEIEEDRCEVIPGSLDGIMAGPQDIVLPATVLGTPVFLSLSLAASLPRKSLGKGFALLDDATYNRIIDSQILFETGEKGDEPSFPFALPYISDNDSRIAYHAEIVDVVQRAQAPLLASIFAEDETEETHSFKEKVKAWFSTEFQPIFDVPETALAAGVERPNPYGEFRVDSYDGIAVLEYSIAEKALLVRLYNKQEEPETARFEGWQIINSNGKTLASIQNGFTSISGLDPFDGRICLMDQEGGLHAFHRSAE